MLCVVANHVPLLLEITGHVHVGCHVPVAVDVDVVIFICCNRQCIWR